MHFSFIQILANCGDEALCLSHIACVFQAVYLFLSHIPLLILGIFGCVLSYFVNINLHLYVVKRQNSSLIVIIIIFPLSSHGV